MYIKRSTSSSTKLDGMGERGYFPVCQWDHTAKAIHLKSGQRICDFINFTWHMHSFEGNIIFEAQEHKGAHQLHDEATMG